LANSYMQKYRTTQRERKKKNDLERAFLNCEKVRKAELPKSLPLALEKILGEHKKGEPFDSRERGISLRNTHQ